MRDDVTAVLEFVVTDADTASALLSGDLQVLATPRLIAWLEAATCEAARPTLEQGQTTVGTRVVVEHRAPSPIGASVRVGAALTAVEGRLLTFDVEATDASSGQVLADGVITRAVVDAGRFLERLGRKP
ncbi:hypothetical protein JCM18899A_25190 [Nocardioides sp. AN3]